MRKNKKNKRNKSKIFL